MPFVMRYPIAWTHDARIEFPAMAIVVAHLDGFAEPPGGVAARSRFACAWVGRIAFHVPCRPVQGRVERSEEHTSELQSLMRTSYAVFCLQKKKIDHNTTS